MVTYRPSNMLVYLRDGSAHTVVRAATCETEVADQTFCLTESQYSQTGPTSPSADPLTPGAWQGSRWSANFAVSGMTRAGKRSTAKAGIESRSVKALPLSQGDVCKRWETSCQVFVLTVVQTSYRLSSYIVCLCNKCEL